VRRCSVAARRGKGFVTGLRRLRRFVVPVLLATGSFVCAFRTDASEHSKNEIIYRAGLPGGSGFIVIVGHEGRLEALEEGSDLSQPVHLCSDTELYRCVKFSLFEFAIPRSLSAGRGDWSFDGVDYRIVHKPDTNSQIYVITGAPQNNARIHFEYVYSLSAGLLTISKEFTTSSGNDTAVYVLASKEGLLD